MANIYEAKATFFTSTLEKGIIRLDEEHFEFSYQNPRLGKKLSWLWSEILQIEVNITLSRKIGTEFSIILNSQAKFRFASKDSGKIIKLCANQLSEEKIVRAPSLFNTLTRSFRNPK